MFERIDVYFHEADRKHTNLSLLKDAQQKVYPYCWNQILFCALFVQAKDCLIFGVLDFLLSDLRCWIFCRNYSVKLSVVRTFCCRTSHQCGFLYAYYSSQPLTMRGS